MRLPRTPSQTVGPFFEFGLMTRTQLAPDEAPGAIRIEGQSLEQHRPWHSFRARTIGFVMRSLCVA